MAQSTEDYQDNPFPSSHFANNNVNNNDTDLSDETQDFRFLTNLSHLSTPSQPPTLPKRGLKDFEPNPTLHQTTTLAASRKAMHLALSHPRFHTPKNHILATYHPAKNLCYVRKPKGPHFRTIGRGEAGGGGGVWLLPEESIWLCERGGLDVRWPSSSTDEDCGEGGEGEGGDEGGGLEEEEEDNDDEGLPMSLQAVYACMLEEDEESGLSLERYTVYAGLKRSGYSVLRAESFGKDVSGGVETKVPDTAIGTREKKEGGYWGWGLFARIFASLFEESARQKQERERLGPLVKPGLYRSY
ncbi:MAG: tRNA-splicing endonuclease subunit sen54, partial [Candelina submexicana]